ncbi:MAG TPA: hypothetical protein VMS17_14715 [Gemmataceae bacterium]|nr:hypothetical protein [Gemmataceae bacterium]
MKPTRINPSRAFPLLAALALAAPAAGRADTYGLPPFTDFEQEWRLDDAAVKGPDVLIARNADEWAALWKKLGPQAKDAPPVDFSRWMVVGVVTPVGKPGRAVYRVELEDAANPKELRVRVAVDGALCQKPKNMAVKGARVHLAAVGVSALPVRFIQDDEVDGGVFGLNEGTDQMPLGEAPAVKSPDLKGKAAYREQAERLVRQSLTAEEVTRLRKAVWPGTFGERYPQPWSVIQIRRGVDEWTIDYDGRQFTVNAETGAVAPAKAKPDAGPARNGPAAAPPATPSEASIPGSVPPPAPRIMPGEVQGRVQSRWLAPYVSVTTRSVGATAATSVQWLTPEGKLDHEAAGPNIDAHAGYIYEYGDGGGVIHGLNGDWTIVLPRKPGPAGYITATEDGRAFVHEFHPKEDEIAADVYVAGKQLGAVGPFLQYKGQDVQLGSDGSLALLAWKDADKKKPQVIAVGPDGKVRFRADCDGPIISPMPAPDGSGVLVHVNASGDARNLFLFYTKDGKASSLVVGPNAGLLAWLPGTTTALMHTSIGYDYRFHLIDWSSGKRLWEIPDPEAARVPGELPSVDVGSDWLLIGGLESVKQQDQAAAVRSIHALDPKTGQVVAHWLPEPPNLASRAGGRFLRHGKILFLVTDEEFSEVNADDIAARKNGWR